MIGAITAGIFSEGAPPVSPTSFESIATVTVGSSGASSIDFTSIPSTFKHLQIRASARSAAGAWNFLTFNSDATQSNYYAHELVGNGSVTGAASYAGGASPKGIQLMVTYGYTSVFTGAVIDILDYTSTNRYKTVRCLNAWDNNGSGEVHFTSGLWSKTPEAITSLSLVTNGGNYQQHTTFALYGIRG